MSGTEPGKRRGCVRRLTGEEINACPLTRWEGPVHVVRTADALSPAVRQLERETLLGFDTETRPAFRKGESYPPALLQLAAEDGVFIFQLHHLGLPKPLRRILAEPGITKAGVAPTYDLRELQKLAPFRPAGFADLGSIAKRAGIQNHGLRGLAAVLMGRRISKAARTSNWAQNTLTQQQVRYAATDAWVGREVYRKLVEIGR